MQRTPSVSYAEAVEVALAWGWIDGQKQALDERTWLQTLTCPRATRSLWSKINRDKATALIAAGKMHAAWSRRGRARQARRTLGRRLRFAERRHGARRLRGGARENARAEKAFFATLDATNRYAMLWRMQTAKKPETRARRIAELRRHVGAARAASAAPEGDAAAANGAR